METEIYDILGKYFRDEISAAEKLHLDEWLISEENRQIFHEVEKVWKHTDKIKTLVKPDIDTEWERFNKLIADPAPIKYIEEKKIIRITDFRKWGLRIAAALIIGVTAYSIFNTFKPASEDIKLLSINSNTEIKEVILPDGSLITLNKETTIEYPENFGNGNRTVYLNGEAFFEVTKGKGTFTVSTEKTKTTVLGTKFNIKETSETEQTELYVTEGKVCFGSINNRKKEIFLAGEEGKLDNNDNSITHKKIQDANKIAWKTGELVFKNSPMSEVQNTVSSYFGKRILLYSEIEKLRFTGSFNNPDLTEFLEVISVSLAVNYQIKNDSVLITK